MTTVLIVIHLMVVLAMIGLVLLQRSEGGALGIGGGGGGNFLSARGAGNVLTRTTAILAATFFATSIGLTVLARMQSNPSDILERLPAQTESAPGGAPQGQQLPTSGGVLDALRPQGGPQTPPENAPQGSSGTSAPAPAAPEPAAPAPVAPAPTAPQDLAPQVPDAQLPGPQTAPEQGAPAAPESSAPEAPAAGDAAPQTPPPASGSGQ